MKSKILLLISLFFLSIGTALGQTITVKGVVLDDKGEAVIGASVRLKSNPSVGAATGLDGDFTLKAQQGELIVVSYVGFKTQEVAAAPSMTIKLVADTELLDEVMVVAYGVAKKESFTGSAAVVNSKEIIKRPVANVTKALDGLVPGLQATSASGQPGSGSSIVIRGFGSLNAANEPLYVVDGIPYDGAINAINPNDIESLTIIKDASAGALYGARGANGVVMITTKKGSEGKVTIDLKANWGVASRAIPRYETMNQNQWVEESYSNFKNYVIREQGVPYDLAGPAAINEMLYGSNKIFGSKQQYYPFDIPADQLFDHNTGKIVSNANTLWDEDWMDHAMAKNPLRQEYQMTFTGGSSKTNYMFSLGYMDENGLVKKTKFDRYSFRSNIDSQVTDWFKTGLNLSMVRSTTTGTILSIDAAQSSNANVFYTAMMMAPIFPMFEKDDKGQTVMDADGNPKYDWGEGRPAGATAGWNPIANLEADRYDGTAHNASGRTYVELGGLKEGILQGLKLGVHFGFDYRLNKFYQYNNPEFGDGKTDKGRLTVSDAETFSYTFNQLLTYNRSFGDHGIDALVGHEFYDYTYKYLSGYKTGFPFKGLYELNAAATVSDASSYTDKYAIQSFLSRLNYDFADRYYLSLSFRRDLTSRFHKDYRAGNFWSIGGSWRISEESFMEGLNWLDNLTLKASYGVQGNDNVNTYYAWQALYNLDYPIASESGALASSLESKDLRWEKNENLNIGLEGRFFNRLSLSLEYYRRYTRDMLMYYPMAMSLGFEGYNKNIGNMLNSGFEFSISGDVVRNDNFRWTSTLMASTVNNKVLNLADKPEILDRNYITREGYPINSFYLAESAGIDPATGKKLYWVWDEDENGNPGEKYITDDHKKATSCREIVGSRMPDLYGSWNNNFTFYGFDLGIVTTYSIGGYIIDGAYRGLLYADYIGANKHVDAAKMWKKPGDVSAFPEHNPLHKQTTQMTSDELTDASYVALKNVTLGYTLPQSWTESLSIQSIRLSLTGENLYVKAARKGLDPQYNLTGGTGYGYTPNRTISFGLDIRF